jgi:hypothetical protein
MLDPFVPDLATLVLGWGTLTAGLLSLAILFDCLVLHD